MNKEINQKSHENSVNSATGLRILLKNEDFQAKHNQNQGNSLKNSQKSDEARKNADNSRFLTESDVNSGISNESFANASDLSIKEENREKVKKIHEHKEFSAKNGDNSMNLSQKTVNPAISKENVAKPSNSKENAEEAMDFKQNNESSAKAGESIENSANAGEKADNSIDIGENAENNIDTDESVENIRNSEAKATSLKDFFNIDSENELKSQFPSVNIENLRNNKDFNELLRLIIQNPTLAQVYSCFNAIVSSTEEHSRKKLAYALASANSGVGSLSSSSKTEQAFFTKEQVLNMSQEEIRRNYTKIRQSQQHW